MKTHTISWSLENFFEELWGHCWVERTVILWFSTQSGAVMFFVFIYIFGFHIRFYLKKKVVLLKKKLKTVDLKQHYSYLHCNVN